MYVFSGVIGVETCQDIIDKRGLILLLFSELSATSFYRIALGIGSTNISEMSNRERKSMSNETTFHDTSDIQKLREICDSLSEELATDLQSEKLMGKQITLKVKTHKFSIRTRVSNLMRPTNSENVIKETAGKILIHFIDTSEDKPLTLRLLGVRMSELVDESQQQETNDQSTLDSFFKSSEPVSGLQTYKCPICENDVQARNETAFNSKHFEKCLASSESSENFLAVAGSSSNNTSSISSRDVTVLSTGNEPEKSVTFKNISNEHTTNLADEKQNKCAQNSSCASTSDQGAFEAVEVTFCPICESKISEEINLHLDLCLNRSVVEKLVSDTSDNDKKEDNNCGNINGKKRKSNHCDRSSSSDALVNGKKPKTHNHKSIKSYFTQY